MSTNVKVQGLQVQHLDFSLSVIADYLNSVLEAGMLETKLTGWWILSSRVGQEALQELSDTPLAKLVPPADVSS